MRQVVGIKNLVYLIGCIALTVQPMLISSVLLLDDEIDEIDEI